MNKSKSISFWVTNISNRNVSLADLNLTIKAYASVNLLDNRHYYYTLAELQKSATEGSLYKKSNMIVIRKVPPPNFPINKPTLQETFIPSRERSILQIKEEKYEELNVSDETFADQNADLAEIDRKKL